MQKVTFKEIKLRLPTDIIESISSKEIINLLVDKALSKKEYYRTKCREMEQKYGTNFTSFKKKVEGAKDEVFIEWDDLIVWEGYELAYSEWKGKYEELRNCMK